MKKFSSILALSSVVILLSSCFNKNPWNTNTSNLASNDVYMRGVKTMPVNNTFTADASMRISRVEPAGDSVRLYTHIIDGDGMFPMGAARSNFRNNWCYLTVNGDPVTQYTVREVQESQNVPTLYALVLDHSGSMGSNAKKMQEAVRNFINKKKPQDAICIVKYDSKANLEVPVNTNISALQSQFLSNGLLGYGGTTAIINGIMKGMETVQPQPYRRKVVISFTDGADNASTVTKEYATWYAQQNNINLCTIDFNHSNYNNFMQELANNTGGTYSYFTNSNQFGNVFDDIVNKMTYSYVVTYKKQTPGFQTVVLRYCGEPQALEANADFSPDRSNAQPVRNTTPPAASSSGSNSASSADRPVYYRPASYYNNTMPGRGPTNSSGNGGAVRQPVNGNPTTTPPRTPGNNGGISTTPGSINSTPGQIRDGQGSTGSPIKPPPANGSGNNSNSGNTKPGNSTGIGTSTKPDTSPIGNNGGSNSSNPGSIKDTPGQIRDGQGSTGSPIKPPPANGSGNNSNSGTTKPGNSTGIGTSTKPDTKPIRNTGNGIKDKPVSQPITTKPSTTKPTGNTDRGNSTKPSTTKPSTNGTSNPTKPASGASGGKKVNGINPSRGPQ